MAQHRGPVLVDTNVIVECHRTGCWRVLAGGYPVETVDDHVTETQTGFQRRRPQQRIVIVALRASLNAVHFVGDRQRAELAVRVGHEGFNHGSFLTIVAELAGIRRE